MFILDLEVYPAIKCPNFRDSCSFYVLWYICALLGMLIETNGRWPLPVFDADSIRFSVYVPCYREIIEEADAVVSHLKIEVKIHRSNEYLMLYRSLVDMRTVAVLHCAAFQLVWCWCLTNFFHRYSSMLYPFTLFSLAERSSAFASSICHIRYRTCRLNVVSYALDAFGLCLVSYFCVI